MRHVAALLTACLLVLLGCDGGSSNNTTATPPPNARGGSQIPGGLNATDQDIVPTAATGEFRFVSAVDHNTLDPQKMSWLHDIRIADCLFEPLVRISLPSTEVEPGVAESWQISEDGKTYTFHLRENAKWSNGDPVTSSDFAYAWRRILMPDFAGDYAQLFFPIVGAEDFFNFRNSQLDKIRAEGSKDGGTTELKEALAFFDANVGIKTPDLQTIEVTLKEPTPYYLELFAFAPFMPNHTRSLAENSNVNPQTGMLELDPTYWTDPAMIVGNGPYVLNRQRLKVDTHLKANPHYWNRAKMRNTSILERVIGEPETAILAYDRGEVDYLPDIPTAGDLAADLLASNRPDVHMQTWAGTYFYSFNCNPTFDDGSKNPLHDPRVRRALSMAIDRQEIVNSVTRMKQPIARSFIPPGALPGYEPPVDAGATYNIAEARKLLAEAGYPDGKGLTGLTILYNTDGGHENIALRLSKIWQEQLGVTIKPESLEVKSFRERLKNQRYTIARASWIGDYRDATTFLDKFQSKGGNNDAKFNNAEYDRLLAEAAAEQDVDARLRLLEQAERILLEEQPIAPIYHYTTMHIFDPSRVKNLYPNVWNYRRYEFVEVKGK